MKTGRELVAREQERRAMRRAAEFIGPPSPAQVAEAIRFFEDLAKVIRGLRY
jgi:hypothetical protein